MKQMGSSRSGRRKGKERGAAVLVFFKGLTNRVRVTVSWMVYGIVVVMDGGLVLLSRGVARQGQRIIMITKSGQEKGDDRVL